MDIINEYKNRFYNLLESTMGDVRPLITEDETVSGSPEFNQIVTNLGLDLEKLDEYTYNIKNGNQLFGGNAKTYTIAFLGAEGGGAIHIDKIDSKLPNNLFKEENNFLRINGITKTTKLETIKTIIQSVINGQLDKSKLALGITSDTDEFYEFYINNSLEGYDAYITDLYISLEDGNKIDSIEPLLFFKSKNPDNKVKNLKHRTKLTVSYGGGFFNKEYVLDGNKISFEQDRKSTKPTGRYKSDSLYDLADTDKYVKYGMKGEIVKQIQHKLLKSGQLKNTYKLAVDNQKCIEDYTFCHGTFGKKTLAAVKEFQVANDLVDDGFVGPDTAEALRNV
jgi:hypothetical protein